VSSPFRVLIVDDHADVRHALAVRLGSAPDVAVVGEIDDADAALQQNESLRPDVLLVETKRTDGRGLELVSRLAHSEAGTKIIVLTSYLSEWEQWAAFRAGALRYLLKDIDTAQLLEQIRAVGAAAWPV
jgi:DNA-binding NarL/FixJ family response regulator